MKGKSVLYALAVIVLTGGLAVSAFAEAPVMEGYDSGESSVWSRPEQGAEQPNAGEIREPMETGAVPDRSISSSDLNCCTEPGASTVESGGLRFRTDIDLGP